MLVTRARLRAPERRLRGRGVMARDRAAHASELERTQSERSWLTRAAVELPTRSTQARSSACVRSDGDALDGMLGRWSAKAA
jgi:hypothetical protein